MTTEHIKVGKWLPIKDHQVELHVGTCSQCGCEPLRTIEGVAWNHCPDCGALMEWSSKWRSMLINKSLCNVCENSGWLTMDAVAACNCCENGEFFTPRKDNGGVESKS